MGKYGPEQPPGKTSQDRSHTSLSANKKERPLRAVKQTRWTAEEKRSRRGDEGGEVLFVGKEKERKPQGGLL